MKRLIFLALSLPCLSACWMDRPPSPGVAASIAGQEILYSEFERYVASSVGEPAAGLNSAVLSRLLDRYLEEEALLMLARDRGIEGTRRSIVEKLLAAEMESRPESDSPRDYYDAHPEEFHGPALLRLLQILVGDRETALAAARAIEAGESFADVASRVSTDPTAVDQGYLALEDLPPAFAEVVARLDPGDTSEVVEAEYGFHLFLVTESLPERVVPFEEARASIEDQLERDASDETFGRLVEQALGRYDLVIHVQNLPFDYSPSPAP